MDVVKVMDSLSGYYQRTRGSGHTKAMYEGTKNTDAVVLYGTNDQARFSGSDEYVTIATIHRLQGMDSPIAIDNAVLSSLFRDASAEIKTLRDKVEAAKKLFE